MLPSGGSGGEGDVYLRVPVQSTGMIAVRAYVYSVDPNVNYTGVIILTNTATTEYLEILATDVSQWSVSDFSATGGLHSTFSTVSTEQGVWTCVRAADAIASLGAASNALYIGDVLVDQGGVDDPAPAYDTIAVGATRADAIGYHVLDDDVVIAHQHIGC